MALCAAVCALAVLILTPKRDAVETDGLPEEYFIDSPHNYIALQGEGEQTCSALAAAYVLRHLGVDADGGQLYPQMDRSFGLMTVGSVRDLLRSEGRAANAYWGTVESLKARLTEGTPVIAFISDRDDTHYVVVTGYDAQYLYLVDSLPDNVNAPDETRYNRRLPVCEFERLWKTGLYLVENLYIVAD